MAANRTLTVDGRVVAIEGEKNLLELIRGADIEIPTFCYHSELSVYGACRLCIVDIEGRGIVSSCSTPPEPGLVVRTNTEELRSMRRMILELLLANGHENCTICPKNGACALQDLARKLGVRQIRFKPSSEKVPLDESSPSLVRDPNKCVLCGDCVRYCREIQGIGAIDFAGRGSETTVTPAFGKGLGSVECVNCGQCAAVCPTGSITPKSEVAAVWAAIGQKGKKVVAQIAPAVRVAIGEQFGMKAGDVSTGQIAAALKLLGFAKVFDTSFAADLTVVEEATEFLGRKLRGEHLPQFTSCCPGWVKFAEQYYPELLGNLSTCRSPQQMFGSIAREVLPAQMGVERADLVVVSIMPCTAKKYEAGLEKFRDESGRRDVDHVLTTQELAQMIEEAGICFADLKPQSLDMPLGFKTGAGMIFGASGGVSEAVLRYASEKIGGVRIEDVEFKLVRGEGGLREARVNVGGTELKLAIVHGLRRARQVAEQVRRGQCQYDLIEVMACPGGCIGGAGQPVARHAAAARTARAHGLYEADRTLQLRRSQDNHYVTELYETCLGDVGGHKAHELLHTHYQSRRRIEGQELDFSAVDVAAAQEPQVTVEVCVGTNCYVKGSQNLLNQLIRNVDERGLGGQVAVQGTFCLERCGKGPNVRIGGEIIERCTVEKAMAALEAELARAAV